MSSAQDFVREHPGLVRAMRWSRAFAAVKEQAALEIDGEHLYIVRGDTLGDEEDLFVETLVRGAQARDPDDPNRAVYDELGDESRALVDERIKSSATKVEPSDGRATANAGNG